LSAAVATAIAELVHILMPFVCNWNRSSPAKCHNLSRLRHSSVILGNSHDKTVGMALILYRNHSELGVHNARHSTQ